MARKYTRDNRGRFASGGSGATARGGRLRTAAGNKRKTETMKAAKAPGSMAAGGPKARPANAIRKTKSPLKQQPQNNISKASLPSASYRKAVSRPLLQESKEKLGKYTRRVMRVAKNTGMALSEQKRVEIKAKVAKGYVSAREAKSYAKAQRSEKVAQAALRQYQKPVNAVAKSPRRLRRK